MGCAWYSFSSVFCSSGILITNKDIKKVREPGSTNEEQYTDPLSTIDVDWILNQECCQGFKLFQLASAFVLVTKQSELSTVGIEVPVGPYEIENRRLICRVKEAAKEEDEYKELFEIARKLTPEGTKLSSPPGQYSFSSENTIEVEELHKKDEPMQHVSTDIETTLPPDFELIVGSGEKKKAIATCKALLSCCLPGFDAMVGDAVMTTDKLELPDLDPDAVELVLTRFTTCKDVDFPRWPTDTVNQVLKMFGLDHSSNEHKPKKIKKNEEQHPVLTDPRWLDATFVVGPKKEEIKACRAVLASMNPVLHRILFGTGAITVDPSTPIEWLEYDTVAVRCVFLALAQRGKQETTVPLESVPCAEQLVDYIMESRDGLNLYYETPFKRELESGFYMKYEESDDYGDFVLSMEE